MPMIIVGNKLDLEQARGVWGGKDLAATYNCPWIETSTTRRRTYTSSCEDQEEQSDSDGGRRSLPSARSCDDGSLTG